MQSIGRSIVFPKGRRGEGGEWIEETTNEGGKPRVDEDNMCHIN